MKIARFFDGKMTRWGIVEDNELLEMEWEEYMITKYPTTGSTWRLSEVELLPPCTPSKIIGVGLNYCSHAQEVNMELPQEPIIFMKPTTAVIGSAADIIIPARCKRVDYEAELGVVIGRKAKNVAAGEANNYICGYTCANDVTARDYQQKNGQWTYSKSFDTFAPIGPWIETELNIKETGIKGILNNEVVQKSFFSDLIFSVEELLEYISCCMTLLPGDVIMTGTPSGIGPLKDGDLFTVSIEGIGELTNRAVLEEDK